MEMKNLMVGIVGMGPIGMTLAVFLKKAGFEVGVCDIDTKKMDLISKEGIKLIGKIENEASFNHIFTSLDQLLANSPDIIICSVKAYQVEALLRNVDKDQVDKKTVLISAQNGIDVRSGYKSHFSDDKILRMVINYAGGMPAPNIAEITFFNPPNYIASVDDSKGDLAKMLATSLASVGLETLSVDSFEIEKKVWEKTILNAALSPLCALTRMTMKEAMGQPDTLEIAEQIIREGVEVAAAEGIKFGDNFVNLCLRYLGKAGNHFPSLALDLMNNNPTEIEYMNGKFVEFGRKHYLKTPMNLIFTNLVRAITEKSMLEKKAGKK